jgi:hypothetical protein
VGQRPAAPVREHLLDDGVAAVLGFGLEQHQRGTGEDGVVATHVKQFVLAAGSQAVEVFDPADDQPGGDRGPSVRELVTACRQ